MSKKDILCYWAGHYTDTVLEKALVNLRIAFEGDDIYNVSKVHN